LLREPDANPVWDNARRSELLEAWRGILWLPRPAEQESPLDLEIMDAGLRLLAGTVAGHDEGPVILRTALRRMVDAIPLDPATWVELIAPYWSDWPELLRDLAAKRWPALEPRPLAELPRLPADLAELWEAFSEDTRSNILRALNGGSSTSARCSGRLPRPISPSRPSTINGIGRKSRRRSGPRKGSIVMPP